MIYAHTIGTYMNLNTRREKANLFAININITAFKTSIALNLLIFFKKFYPHVEFVKHTFNTFKL